MSHRISIGSLKLPIFLLILIGFAGCGRTIRWEVKQYSMKEGMVPDFVGQQPVNVINAQESTEEVLIGESLGGNKYVANLQKWTDTAIRIVETELHQRNIVTNVEAEKKIKFAITEAHFDIRGAIQCKVDLKVETGDGYTMVFTRMNQSQDLHRACGRAVLWAAAAALNDDTILAYLKL